MSERKRRSMKNLLIMKGFQGRLLLLVILVGFLCTCVNGSLYYFYVSDSYDLIFKYTSSSIPQIVMEDRYRDLLSFGLYLMLASFLMTLVIAFWTLIITHRSAGACYRMQLIIDEIKSGNVDARVNLRKKDEFKELAAAFNEMMDELHK